MSWGRLATTNYRGAVLPRTLGLVLIACAAIWTVLYGILRQVDAAGWGALAGLGLVFSAGLVDDLVPSGPRGLRNHLRALRHGHMTTGILKMLAAVSAAGIVVVLQPPRPGWVRLAAVVLIAACANVWNGLDVRPGRALKAFLLPGLAFVLWGEIAAMPAVAGVLLGALLVLPLDLRELAMLGDGGANVLGFAAGMGLYAVLPGGWVAAAAAIAVALNVAAETVSFSSVIDATRPLRWIDGLGRRQHDP